MKNSVDGKNIIVVGAGIGGLSAGILLSQAGYHVTVVEKNPRPGGLMRSYRRSGLDCPVGVHYVGALGAQEPLGMMFQGLGIPVDDLFVPMNPDGIIDRYIFDDFTFDLPGSTDAFENNLREGFPEDNAAIDVIMVNLREMSRRLMDPSFLFQQGDPFQNMDYYQPMGGLLDELGASAGLRAVLGVPCNLIGVPLNDCPVIFHHMVLASYLFSSWRPKDNGSRMTEGFVRRLQETGGDVIVNNGVRNISVAEGKVNGVTLASEDFIEADAVVCSIHPKKLSDLLEENVLRESYARRLRGLHETQSVLGVQVKLDAERHPEIQHNIYRLHADDQGRIDEGVFYQLRGGNGSPFNLLSIITKSLYEDWAAWEHTFSSQRGRDYEDKKMRMAEALLNDAEKILGRLEGARIIDVYTPLTIRDYVNAPEGACYGIMRSSRQLLRAISLNNVPVAGLFLAGQNAVAPGVMGCLFGSFNVARQMIGSSK